MRRAIADTATGERFAAVLVRKTALVSTHVYDVDGEESVHTFKRVMDSMRAVLNRWLNGEHPSDSIILGIDANVQVPRKIAGITGSRLWRESITCRWGRLQTHRFFGRS